MDYELLTTKINGLSAHDALALILNHYKVLINQVVYAAVINVKDVDLTQYEARVKAVFVALEANIQMAWTDKMVVPNIEDKLVDFIYPAEVSIFRAVAAHTKFPSTFAYKKRIQTILTDLCAQLSCTIRSRRE